MEEDKNAKKLWEWMMGASIRQEDNYLKVFNIGIYFRELDCGWGYRVVEKKEKKGTN